MSGQRTRHGELSLWAGSILFTALAAGVPGWFARFGPGRGWPLGAEAAALAAYGAALGGAWLALKRVRTRRERRWLRENGFDRNGRRL